jgi:hypothetical protein
MITVRKNKAYFTGKDKKWLEQESKDLGLSIQETFTGMMWEMIMREARKGVFLEKKAK